jgi:hypothetical protein
MSSKNELEEHTLVLELILNNILSLVAIQTHIKLNLDWDLIRFYFSVVDISVTR